MNYSTFVPDLKLQSLVECYWIVEGTDTEWQKIAPDGYTEMIFHFGDRYRVRHSGKPEELQPYGILAGQIDIPIFLRPEGKSGVLGIKFHPTGIWKLFGIDMSLLTNQTADLDEFLEGAAGKLIDELRQSPDNNHRVLVIETFLLSRQKIELRKSEIDPVITAIHNSKGQISIQEVADTYKLSLRKIERLFKQHVGVSAKLYSRLIRFAHIYKMIQKPELTKAEATYLSGYFDQAHFNKEFKEFAGESPEDHFLQNHPFSNFFLNR
jgi:AraC-like DNA-binding protein